MKKFGFALAAAAVSALLMGQAPGLQMIELHGQNHAAFPCKDKNKRMKRSQCVDWRGWGGIKGRVFVEDYIIHCVAKGGTKDDGKPITYVSWNRMGRCK